MHSLALIHRLGRGAVPVATIRPAALMGGQFLPGAIARRTAPNATLIPIVHPGQAPPEPRYRPSKKLIDFVRCRDMTCRFPGCTKPATDPFVDVDHTVAWPHGPTSASNLKCLCRHHHLLKAFWGGAHGWRDRQLEDGTVIWTAPDGTTPVTTPGSRLLFPELCEPSAPVTVTAGPTTPKTGLTMPRRKTTRAQGRRHRIRTERDLTKPTEKPPHRHRHHPNRKRQNWNRRSSSVYDAPQHDQLGVLKDAGASAGVLCVADQIS